jgi:hypothetical protein
MDRNLPESLFSTFSSTFCVLFVYQIRLTSKVAKSAAARGKGRGHACLLMFTFVSKSSIERSLAVHLHHIMVTLRSRLKDLALAVVLRHGRGQIDKNSTARYRLDEPWLAALDQTEDKSLLLEKSKCQYDVWCKYSATA